MKRRKFGLLAGSSLAAVAVATTGARPALAQSAAADPSLLTTTLTPYGAERAGNADGSIPAWTGGLVGPPLPPGSDYNPPEFENEQKLYTVDASNLAQYQNQVTPGLAQMITKFGYHLNVYPCHRTAAAPQYVYDNIAKNVTRAKFDPAGGRFGFLDGYGGIPFPIIDTSDPEIAGTQIVWNHLTHFEGFNHDSSFAPAIVCSSGQLVLTGGSLEQSKYPYYDPNGTLETFSGYFSKLHSKVLTPPQVVGQEQIVWHTTNVTQHPDIVWTLLNGQGRVRKAPNEAYDTPNPNYNAISNIDESQAFYGNPSKYDWKFISKSEMLIPYNCNSMYHYEETAIATTKFPNPDLIRWEKHRVWVVEATLHPGERNVLLRRRFYADEDTGQFLAGESYDADENMVRVYFNPCTVKPNIPMVNPVFIVIFDVRSGDYVMQGSMNYPGYPSHDSYGVDPDSAFDPQQMAAGAAY